MSAEKWESKSRRISVKILEGVGTGIGAELLLKVAEKILRGPL